MKNLEKSLAQVVKDFERERERLLAQVRGRKKETVFWHAAACYPFFFFITLKDLSNTKVYRP